MGSAFEFVRLLASELSAGTVELPSFPEVALRVQRVLSDESSTPDRVVQVVGTEPALASRILRMANSAALNATGTPIVELRTAVNRMGFDMLRSAALSFAIAQLRHSPQYVAITHDLHDLWKRSMRIGVFAFVLARRRSRLNPDSALLAGVLHGVGRLYILARSIDYPDLFNEPVELRVLIEDWHMNIAKVLLENWGMAPEIVEAVHKFLDPEAGGKGAISLVDVLAGAHLLSDLSGEPELRAAQVSGSVAAKRLGITAADVEVVLSEAQAELQSLLEALQG